MLCAKQLIKELFYSNDGYWSPDLPSNQGGNKKLASKNDLQRSRSLNSLFSDNSYLSMDASELLRTTLDLEEFPDYQMPDNEELEKIFWEYVKQIFHQLRHADIRNLNSKKVYFALVKQYQFLAESQTSLLSQPDAVGNATLIMSKLHFIDIPRNHRENRFFAVITNGLWVHSTKIMNTSNDYITFDETILLQDLSPSFDISVQLFRVTRAGQFLHLMRQKLFLSRLRSNKNRHPGIKDSKTFKMIREFRITRDDLMGDFLMDVTFNRCPLYQFKLKVSHVVTKSKTGIIKVLLNVNNEPVWEYRWYVLSSGALYLYKGSQSLGYEKKYHLKYCTYAKILDHDNIVVKMVRPKEYGDKNSIPLKSKNHFVFHELRFKTHYFHHQFAWRDTFNDSVSIIAQWKSSFLSDDELNL